MKVILISGKAQNGKDTVAKMLSKKLDTDGYRTIVVHYGDLLKFICKSYFKWDGVKDENGRRLLQYVGTDIIRAKDPNMWVDFVGKMLQYFYREWDYVIIADCRFPNEIETLKNMGFDTVHLRVKRTNFDSPLSLEQQQHPSETALDQYPTDYIIDNSSDLNDLREKVLAWVGSILYV